MLLNEIFLYDPDNKDNRKLAYTILKNKAIKMIADKFDINIDMILFYIAKDKEEFKQQFTPLYHTFIEALDKLKDNNISYDKILSIPSNSHQDKIIDYVMRTPEGTEFIAYILEKFRKRDKKELH